MIPLSHSFLSFALSNAPLILEHSPIEDNLICEQAKITLIGVGSANTRTALVLMRTGVKAGNIIMMDRNGFLHPNREDVEAKKKENPRIW